jgi:hypothetical protein
MNCQAFLHHGVQLSANHPGDLGDRLGHVRLGSVTPADSEERGESESFGALAVGGQHGTQASSSFVQTGGGTTIVSPSRRRGAPFSPPNLIGIRSLSTPSRLRTCEWSNKNSRISLAMMGLQRNQQLYSKNVTLLWLKSLTLHRY